MTTIHPTTLAIVLGLRGEAPTSSPFERALTRDIHKLVIETDLKDAKEIAAAGVDGWDLGFKREATRYEITVRRRDETDSEILISALLDRRNAGGWSYIWIVQRSDSKISNSAGQYQNGLAQSFAAAVFAARLIKE